MGTFSETPFQNFHQKLHYFGLTLVLWKRITQQTLIEELKINKFEKFYIDLETELIILWNKI